MGSHTGLPLLLANTALALVLTGLIWTIQVVHYPLMAHVGETARLTYQAIHQRTITPLVAPLMLAELMACLLLFASPPPAMPAWAAWTQGLLVGVVWLSTMFIQVPLHGRLSAGEPVVAALVASNWIRTLAWTTRSSLLVLMLWRYLAK